MKNPSHFSIPKLGGGLLLLLAGCAGDEDAAQRVASTESELAAANESWASARSEARACFEAFRSCEQSAGRGAAACRDELKACLPAQAPRPASCSADGGAAPAHFGGLGGSGSGRCSGDWDKKGGSHRRNCDAGVPGGGLIAGPGGTGTPGGTGIPGGTGTPGGSTTGGTGGTGGPGGTMGGTPPVEQPPVQPPPVEEPPVEEPPVEEPPVEEPPVVLGLIMGGTCEAPSLTPGALEGCRSRAASQLAGGGAMSDTANQTLGCIASSFEQRIAKLCAKATELCSELGAPADACTRLTAACSALGAGD
jgi:hypothetical protein